MKRYVVVILVLMAAASVSAREPTGAKESSAQADSLEGWIQQNIDPDVLRLLSQLDEEKAQRLFVEFQAAMNGTNIYRLSALRDTARQVSRLLLKYEETAPVGEWLETRLDYLEAAAELESQAKARAPKASHLQTLPAPTIQIEQQVWRRKLNKRPWPPEARTYLPALKEAFAAEGVPAELAWLAEIESSFNPNARSPAGAVGMFQLMPNAARDEQLSLWPWDERLQPEKSARAAARRLRLLHARYGDWELALAAYNAGESRVDRLLKQHKARSFEAIAPFLPVETQMYVPRFEATLREREGEDLRGLKG